MEDIDSIKEKVKVVKKNVRAAQDEPLPTYSEKSASSSMRTPSIGKTTMVGFEAERIQIMERLTTGQSSHQVIPVVGMGGIGKTTLARSVYDDPLFVHYFDVRIWITISQQYNVANIISQVLLQIPNCQREQYHSEVDRLGEVLYKSLFGRRYLVVLDDLWSMKAWDDFKIFFPENHNMSRMLLTTRQSDVAVHFSSCSLKLNFLNDDDSWKLFREKVFKDESCPPELYNIGKKIVQKCRGLPLTINVMGGLLAKSIRTQKYWETVAGALISILNSSDEEHSLNLLSLSYTYLPTHLKPCFLYMGTFPEDQKICVSQLIKLWIAEGFLKPQNEKTLEEIAQGYLEDLVNRNLVLVSKTGLNGKIKSCYIHDLLRDLCLKISEEEEFFCVMEESDKTKLSRGVRHLLWHGLSWKSDLLINSCKLQPCDGGVVQSSFKNGDQLRFWSVDRVASSEAIPQQVNLRFLGFYPMYDSTIIFSSSHWNLQTLVCHTDSKVDAPIEIWEMQHLRHVEFSNLILPDPPIGEGDILVLKHFHTLLKVINLKWTGEVLKRIPYIKKVKFEYINHSEESRLRVSDFCLHNLAQFQKLEFLNVGFYVGEEEMGRDWLQYVKLPSSLKKLIVTNPELHWNDLSMFGSLPHLEVLKLLGRAIKGCEWNPMEGEFRSLKSLKIENCGKLTIWNVESFHFPVLENLHFGFGECYLDEIPSSIGDIHTLQSISLSGCGVPTAISAMKMLIEQESFGNEGPKVRVCFTISKKCDIFNEHVELQGLTCKNFDVSSFF